MPPDIDSLRTKLEALRKEMDAELDKAYSEILSDSNDSDPSTDLSEMLQSEVAYHNIREKFRGQADELIREWLAENDDAHMHQPIHELRSKIGV